MNFNPEAMGKALDTVALIGRFLAYAIKQIREGHPERVENILPGHYRTELERNLAEAERDAKFGAPA